MDAARCWLPRGLGLFVALYFALLCAPGPYWLDSAELSASALGLGASHPTGFPLYMMLGKLASLLPIGELAFRMNLLSALCAGFAVGGVAKLILILGREDWATIAGAAAGAAVLAASLLFARQATVAEVYAPTAALLVLSLLLFEAVARGGSAAVGLSLAWVAGLGFGLHPSYRLLMGLPILSLLIVRLYRGARWPLLAPMLTTLGAFAVHLYLPIRSASGRVLALDWGHAQTLHSTIAHATAAETRARYADRMMSTTSEVWYHDLSVFADQLSGSLGLLALLAAVIGLLLLLLERRNRWLAGAIVAVILLDGLYAFWINPMGLRDLQNGVPLSIALCICAGVGVASLSRPMGVAAPFVGAVAGLALFLPPVLLSAPALAEVGDLPRAVGEASMLEAAPHSVYLTQSDSISASTLYLQEVEGLRPDIAALRAQGLADEQRTRELLERSQGTETQRAGAGLDTLEGLLASVGRPAMWENGVAPARARGQRIGPLASTHSDRSAARSDTRPAFTELSRLFAARGHRNRVARRVLANALTELGRVSSTAEEHSWAQQLFEAGIEVYPQEARTWLELGRLHAKRGKTEKAALAAERALQIEPNEEDALLQAARYRMLLEDLERAQQHLGRALRLHAKSAQVLAMAGLLDIEAGELARARERLQRALVLDPEQREARAALDSLDADR